MTTQQDIRQMLEDARSHEIKAESLYWDAKESEYHDERSYLYDKERDEAHAARYLRAKAWALVQADPSLKPPGVEVPEVHMPEPSPAASQRPLWEHLLWEHMSGGDERAELFRRMKDMMGKSD